jgi:hypothetical protein
VNSQLKKQLDYVDSTRKKRIEVARTILEKPELIPSLLEIALEQNNPTGSRAAWVLEFVFKEASHYLHPLLDAFADGLKRVVPESSIRPLAKICEMLLLSYYNPAPGRDRPPLTNRHKRIITEACFDWLISTDKAAPKAYSMRCLQLLGMEIAWVHPQLKGVLEQNYATGSPAYRARARQVLKKLA